MREDPTIAAVGHWWVVGRMSGWQCPQCGGGGVPPILPCSVEDGQRCAYGDAYEEHAREFARTQAVWRPLHKRGHGR